MIKGCLSRKFLETEIKIDDSSMSHGNISLINFGDKIIIDSIDQSLIFVIELSITSW